MRNVVADITTSRDLVFYGLAGTLALPAQSLPQLDAGEVLKALGARLEMLEADGQIAHVSGSMQGAWTQASSLVLDVLESGNTELGVEDAVSRRRWLAAARAAVEAPRTSLPPPMPMQWTPRSLTAPSEEALRVAVTGLLQGASHALLAGTPMPRSLSSAMRRSEQAGLGWFDAFALFVAWEIKKDARFRAAIFGDLTPSTVVFGVEAEVYFHRLFDSATLIAQRFDAHLKLARDAPATAVFVPDPDPLQADADGYWLGTAEAVAALSGLSEMAMRAIAQAAQARSLPPETAGGTLREAATLLAGLQADLSTQLDLEDASPVAHTLDEHGPAAALAQLAGASRSAARPEHNAALLAIQAKLRELDFDYRRAVDLHLQAVDQLVDAPEERARFAHALIDTLIRFGRAFRQPDALERAAALCASLLGSPQSNDDPDLRRRLKTSEGDAFLEQGKQLPNYAASLTRAEAAYREALATLPPDAGGEVAGALHARRGEALLALATRTNVAALFDQAAEAFRQAAAILDRSRHPQPFADVQTGLGDALVASAKGERRAARLAEAIAAFDLARGTYPPAVDPCAWAEVQAKYGSARGTLAREGSDREGIEEALLACERALQVLRPGLFALRRAEVLAEIGVLHAALAAGADWLASLRLAAAAYALADAEPQLRAERPLLWVQNKQRWCGALLRLGADAENMDLLGPPAEGLVACGEALAARKNPWVAAAVEHAMGETLAARARLTDSLADLHAAEAAYRRAVALRSPQTAPQQWAQSWIGIASVLSRTVERDESRVDDLRQVARHLEAALELEAVQGSQTLVQTIVARLADARQVLPG